MSTKIHELVAVFNAQLSGFRSGVKGAISLVDDFHKVTTTRFKSIQKSASDMSDGVKDSFRAIEKTAVRSAAVIGGSMTLASAAVGKLGFDFIKTKDNALLAFEAMLGSGEKALAFYEKLADFEKRTPFEMPGLLKAAQRLLSSKIAAEKVIPVMTSLGDAVALVGGNSENIDRAVVAISQMAAKQKISAQEMNQLAENQVFGWEALAHVMGVTVPEAMEMAEKDGARVFKHFDAFLLQIGKTAEGSMQKQSKMLGGLLSTASSAASVTAGTIFEPLYREATKFLAWAMGPTGFGMGGVVEQLRQSVADLSKDLFLYLQVNGQKILTALGRGFVTFGEMVRSSIGFLRANGAAITGAATALMGWVGAIGRWMAEHPRLMAALIGMKVAFATGIPSAVGGTIKALVSLGLQLTMNAILFRAVFGTSLISMIVQAVRHFGTLIAASETLRKSWVAISVIKLFGGWTGAFAGVLSKVSLLVGAFAALKVAVLALVAGTAYQVGVWARQWVYGKDWIAEMNKELERSIRLTEELIALRDRNTGNAIQDALNDPNRERGRATVEAGIKEEGASIYGEDGKSGISGKIKALQDEIKRLSSSPNSTLETGAKIAAAQKNLEEEQKLLDAAKKRYDAWMEARGEFIKEDSKPKDPEVAPAAGGIPGMPEDKKLTDEEKRALRIRRHARKEEEKGNPLLDGYAGAMDIVEGGASPSEIADYLAGMDGADAEDISRSGGYQDWLEKIRSDNEKWIKDWEEYNKQQLAEGKITQEEFDKQMADVRKRANQSILDTTEKAISQAVTDANKRVQERDRTTDTENDVYNVTERIGDDLPKEQIDGFAARLEALRQQFIKGELTEKEYARAVKETQSEIDKAVEASKAAKRDAEDRARAGQEAGRDYGKLQTEGIAPNLQAEYDELLSKLRSGSITVADFNAAMGTWQQKVKASQESLDSLRRITEGVFGKTFARGSEAFRMLEDRHKKLREAMEKGALSIDDFNDEMRKLEDQAEKAAQAERENRLLRGDFIGAGMDPWKAVRDRLLGIQEGRFNEMIDGYVNMITGAGRQFVDVIDYAGGAIHDFADSLPGGQSLDQAWNTIANFLQTIEGQRANALQTIQLLRQSLAVTDDALSRQDLQAKIDDLIRQLQVLDQQEADLPTFIADRGELDFRDPGMSGERDRGGGGAGVSITFPNVTRVSQAEASQLVDILQREMGRRGR